VSTTPTAEVSVTDLGPPGPVLGHGGQAIVYDLPGFRLPGEPQRLVYKAYKTGMGPSRHSVDKLIARRHRLDPAVRDRLDAVTVWPLAAVVDGAELRGVVLPRIPDAFFQQVVLPSGSKKEILREVQHLFVDPARNDMIKMPTPSPEERLRVCRDLADVLALLHSDELKITFGDLNAKNELFRLDAEPHVMLLDCDAARVRGDMGQQPNTPDWIPPTGEPLSALSDRFKFGLFVLRCLTPGDQGSTRTDPGAAAAVLDATGVDLLRDAIQAPPTRRPSTLEWYQYLSRCLGEPLGPPSLGALTLDRTFVAAGEPLTVGWSAQEAETVEFHLVDCEPVVVDGIAGQGTVDLYPTRTGKIRAVARNRLGEVAAATPPVLVIDAPRLADLPVQVPSMTLPDLGGITLPEVTAVLPPLPAVGAVGLPAAAEPVGAWLPPPLVPEPPLVDPAGPPPGFDSGPTAFPLDTVAILSGAPDLGTGPTTPGGTV
jgi:hypothetical protein